MRPFGVEDDFRQGIHGYPHGVNACAGNTFVSLGTSNHQCSGLCNDIIVIGIGANGVKRSIGVKRFTKEPLVGISSIGFKSDGIPLTTESIGSGLWYGVVNPHFDGVVVKAPKSIGYSGPHVHAIGYINGSGAVSGAPLKALFQPVSTCIERNHISFTDSLVSTEVNFRNWPPVYINGIPVLTPVIVSNPDNKPCERVRSCGKVLTGG